MLRFEPQHAWASPHPRWIFLELVNNKTTQNSVFFQFLFFLWFHVFFYSLVKWRVSSMCVNVSSKVCVIFVSGVLGLLFSTWFQYRHPRVQSVSHLVNVIITRLQKKCFKEIMCRDSCLSTRMIEVFCVEKYQEKSFL